MVNAFSFCLYGGTNPRYYVPLIENIRIAAQYFPDWKVWIYVAPDVDPDYLTRLGSYSNVVLSETHALGEINMIHRFCAIDEPGVDMMMVRDADSIINWRDRWAIREFVNQPRFIAHTIRDNKMHTACLMGGLWGLRKSAGISIRDLYRNYTENAALGHRFAHDQNFLLDEVYPRILPGLLVHYSNNLHMPGEYAIAFPFQWDEETYCGRIVDATYIDAPSRLISKAGMITLPMIPVRMLDLESRLTSLQQAPVPLPLHTAHSFIPTSQVLRRNFLSKR